MLSIIFEIIFAMLKKLYRFFGPALIVFFILLIEIIAVPDVAEDRARREAKHKETLEITSFEEVRYDEASMDRVFRVGLKNNGADASTTGMLAITDEKGKSIYGSIRTEFYDLHVDGHTVIIDYIPPGCESIVELWIDDYKLEGLDHIYIADLYSDDKRGKKFDIEKK